jgi:glycosyltransferase involved in cell wall biosynthesis
MAISVLHYTEFKDRLERSGIGTSVNHQRKAISRDTDIDMKSSFEVSNYLNPPDVDILHTNFVGPKTLSVIQRMKGRVPIISHAHITSEDFGDSFRFSNRIQPITRRYLKKFYSLSDLILCPSEYTKNVIEKYNTGTDIQVITNGVDIESLEGYKSMRSKYRNRYNLSNTTVFTLGNVFERKGLSTFIKTAKKLPDYDFVWFGPYDTGPQASKMVKKHINNPPNNVTFSGWIEDKRGAFAAGDIYFFPTKEENQGIATLESMACGIPVVLNDIPVFREHYEHNTDCLISSSVEGFTENIRLIEEDDELSERLGKNAKSTAKEHSLDKVSTRIEDIYENMIE